MFSFSYVNEVPFSFSFKFNAFLIGVPLIAINPFQDVAELYDEQMVEKYKGISPVEVKV